MGRRTSRASWSGAESELETHRPDQSHIISARHNGRMSRSTLPRPLLTLPPRRPAPVPAQTLLGRVGKLLGSVAISQVLGSSNIDVADQ